MEDAFHTNESGLPSRKLGEMSGVSGTGTGLRDGLTAYGAQYAVCRMSNGLLQNTL